MLESCIAAGATEKSPGGKNLTHIQWRGPTSLKDMLRNALSCTVTWQTRKWSIHQFKQEELESVGEVSEFCSQVVLKCLYLAQIGRLDILWSVNKLAKISHEMDLRHVTND